jgi:D-alanine-D-alanine ligase-like ATP-grasp enzyme
VSRASYVSNRLVETLLAFWRQPRLRNSESIITEVSRISRRIDAVLNLIHGHPGEDGTLAMAWEQAGIAYSSCSPAASALTFHKFWTNALAQRLGLRVFWIEEN